MVLKTKDMIIDIDKVTFIHDTEQMVCVDGQGVHLRFNDDFEAVKKAYDWNTRTFQYDKNLNRIKGGKG